MNTFTTRHLIDTGVCRYLLYLHIINHLEILFEDIQGNGCDKFTVHEIIEQTNVINVI